jgi:hypothetical protein
MNMRIPFAVLLVFALLLQPAFAQVCAMQMDCAQTGTGHAQRSSTATAIHLHHHDESVPTAGLRAAVCIEKVQIGTVALATERPVADLASVGTTIEFTELLASTSPSLRCSSLITASSPLVVPLRN